MIDDLDRLSPHGLALSYRTAEDLAASASRNLARARASGSPRTRRLAEALAALRLLAEAAFLRLAALDPAAAIAARDGLAPIPRTVGGDP